MDKPLIDAFAFRTREIADLAWESGATSLFGGLGGDLGPSFKGTGDLVDLFYQGRLGETLKLAKAQAKFQNTSLYYILRRHLVPGITPQFLRSIWHAAKNTVKPDSPINPEFANEFPARMPPLVVDNKQLRDQRSFFLKAIKQDIVGADWGSPYAATIEFQQPFLDMRVVDFCMRIPLQEFARNGVARSLLRNAGADLLPEIVLNRSTKGYFAPDFALRLQQQAPDLKDFIHGFAPHNGVWKFLDRNKMLFWLDQAAAGPDQPKWDLRLQTVLWRGLAHLAFLQRFGL